MPTTEIRAQKIVAEQLGQRLDDVKAESTFESLGADSLDQVELVMALEDEFDIEITDEDGELITGVPSALVQVEKYLALKQPA